MLHVVGRDVAHWRYTLVGFSWGYHGHVFGARCRTVLGIFTNKLQPYAAKRAPNFTSAVFWMNFRLVKVLFDCRYEFWVDVGSFVVCFWHLAVLFGFTKVVPVPNDWTLLSDRRLLPRVILTLCALGSWRAVDDTVWSHDVIIVVSVELPPLE